MPLFNGASPKRRERPAKTPKAPDLPKDTASVEDSDKDKEVTTDGS